MICFLAWRNLISLGLVRGIKDDPDVGRHFGFEFLARYISLRILLEMELTALPGYAAKNGPPSSLQTSVGIADNQLDPTKTPFDQAVQKGSPMDLLFAQRN